MSSRTDPDRQTPDLAERIAAPESPSVPTTGGDDDETIGFSTTDASRESASRALIQVLIGLVLCASGLGFYVWWSKHAHQAKTLAVEGAELVQNADTRSLNQAIERFTEAREHQSGNAYAIAGLAEAHTLLWVDHGFDDARPGAIELVALARERNIEKAERYAAEVLAAYGEGRYAEAEKTAAAVIEKGGVSEKLYFALGLTQRALGQMKLGRDNLRRAHDLKGDAPHYATALGDAYDEDNDGRNARFFWKLAAERNPDYELGVARSLAASIERGLDKEQAASQLADLDQEDRSLLGKRDQGAIELARAAFFTRYGPGKEAMAAATRSQELLGDTPRVLVARARAQLAYGKTEAGLESLEAAQKARPDSERYLFTLVDAYLDNGRVQPAIQALEGSAGKMAQDPAYYTKLGDAYLAKKDLDEANEAYDKALELHDAYFGALLGKGKASWARKRYEEATEWMRRAVAEREAPEVYEAVGLMFLERRYHADADIQLVEAERRYRAAKRDPRKMSAFYATVINAYKRSGRGGSPYVKAWAKREEAHRREP